MQRHHHCRPSNNSSRIHARLKSSEQQQLLYKKSLFIASPITKKIRHQQENSKKLPRWKILLLLLSTLNISFLRFFVKQSKTQQRPVIVPAPPATKKPITTVHNLPLETMTGECRMKWTGISSGRVCEFQNKTMYLKLLKPLSSVYELSANGDGQGMLSYEHFNRQLVEKCMGAKVPVTRFFKFTNWRGVESVYIGGEGIADVTNKGTIWNSHLSDVELGKRGVAKLAVATTLFRDLHAGNVGYNRDGLVFIDIDSAGLAFERVQEYLDYAYWSIFFYAPPLSIDNLYEMNDIYYSMMECPLPDFHNDFKLSTAMFQAVLTHYIEAGRRAVEVLRSQYKHLGYGHDASYEVNNVWSHQLYLSSPR